MADSSSAIIISSDSSESDTETMALESSLGYFYPFYIVQSYDDSDSECDSDQRIDPDNDFEPKPTCQEVLLLKHTRINIYM